MRNIILNTLTCKRCGNEWIPRVISKQCPKCKSYNWDNDNVRKYVRKKEVEDENIDNRS